MVGGEIVSHVHNGGQGRCYQVARVIRLGIRLAQGWHSAADVYGKSEADLKRFQRDLRSLERAGIPVMEEEHRYRVDAHFMRRFL